MKGKRLTSDAARQRRKWYGTSRWKRLRLRVLAAHPICCICFKAPSTQADHVEHRDDNATFWVWDNLRGACADCNNRMGAKARHRKGENTGRGGGFGNQMPGKSAALGSTAKNIKQNQGHRNDALSIAERLLNED